MARYVGFLVRPWFRNVTIGFARSAQYGHWLSGLVAPVSARTSGSGSQPGDPAVIEKARSVFFKI